MPPLFGTEITMFFSEINSNSYRVKVIINVRLNHCKGLAPLSTALV